MRLVLLRTSTNEKQIIGNAMLLNNQGVSVLNLATLELPFIYNSKNISAIPLGKYVVIPRYSAKHKHHFHITNVAGRDLILLHSGNYFRQTEGCVLVGLNHKDLDGDGYLDTTNSKLQLSRLLSYCPNGFILEIIESYS